jgi:hypothetical protein
LLQFAVQNDWILSMTALAISSSVIESPVPGVPVRYRAVFAVAEIAVEVTGDTPQSTDLGPQLLPFAVDRADCDIELEVAWRSTLDPCPGPELFNSGCVWSVHKFGDDFAFDFATERLGRQPYKRLLVDKDFRYAKIVLNRQCLTPDAASRALEYPLDELLITHHLSLGRGVELHACGLVNASGQSSLFVGHSGAGKSTTARLWTRHLPVQVLSDDRIIVRKRDGRFFMHGTPWHGEAAFALPQRAPIQRIFLLEHGSENRIEPVSRGAAAAELLARSFTPFYSRRFVEPVLALLEEMAVSLPCYRFQFVPDQSAVEKILGFRD